MESRGMPTVNVPDVLVFVLSAISLGMWLNLIWRWKQVGWPLSFRLRRPVPWHPYEAVIVIVIVLFVVALGFDRLFTKTSAPADVLSAAPYSLRQTQVQCGIQAVSILLIPFVLSLWHICYWADFGLARREWLTDLKAGLWGLLLALLPVNLLLLPLQAWRDQSPHPVLEFLKQSPHDSQVLFWIALQVVVLAPLLEELLFRVVLQGALCRELPPYYAIILSSVAFVAIHSSMADWIPLLPLALILGYVYYRRQSFLAVVILHGLFNGINLIMALTMDVPEPTVDPSPISITLRSFVDLVPFCS
jgi:membrane protease YdiL (CAAX protease family)